MLWLIAIVIGIIIVVFLIELVGVLVDEHKKRVSRGDYIQFRIVVRDNRFYVQQKRYHFYDCRPGSLGEEFSIEEITVL